MKHRYGEVDVEFATNFFGKINYFNTIPLPNDIYDYNKYKTPNYIINKEDEEIDEIDNSEKNTFKLILWVI